MAIPPTTLHPILPILPWPSRWRKITRNFHKLPRPIRSSESSAPGFWDHIQGASRLPQSWNPRKDEIMEIQASSPISCNTSFTTSCSNGRWSHQRSLMTLLVGLLEVLQRQGAALTLQMKSPRDHVMPMGSCHEFYWWQQPIEKSLSYAFGSEICCQASSFELT